MTARRWLILRRKKGTTMSLTKALDVTSSAQWLSVVQKEPMLATAGTANERMKHTDGFLLQEEEEEEHQGQDRIARLARLRRVAHHHRVSGGILCRATAVARGWTTPRLSHTQMSAPSAVGDRTHGALTFRHSTAIPFYPLRGVFTHARPHVTMRAPLALPAPPSAPRRCSPHAWPPRIIRTHPVRWCSTECTTRADARAHRQGEIKMRRWSCPAA